MYSPSSPSSARQERTVDRPRRLVVEAYYTTASGQPSTQATRYSQGAYGHPWPDTATKILRDLQKSPPHPGLVCHGVQLIDSGAKVVLSKAGDEQPQPSNRILSHAL